MKRQSAEEYTKERTKGAEAPEEKIKRLMHEASEIADASGIPFLAMTSEGADLSGKGTDLFKLSMIAAATVAVEVGAPVEEFERIVTTSIRPAYEVVKRNE